ncbi:MAG: molybdopterin oxidoreductase family protein [Chloroflexota bacterium]
MESRDSITDVWGPRTPHRGAWHPRVDVRTVEEPDRWVQSACIYCSTGCGIDIGVKDGRIVGVRGREVDRVNLGRLGPKGLNAWEANGSGDRLTRPLMRRSGRLEEASWDEAMGLIVERTKGYRDRYGAGSIGFYNTGQLFLEEYYTLSMIGDAGIGTSHMDGNTRLCTATAALALIESFGTDGAPGSYTDFDVTDAIAMYGHNMASTQTVIWMRVLDRLAGPNPPKLVVVDPRATVAARHADVHLAPRPGTNLPLLNAIQNVLIERNWIDKAWVDDHTVGYEALANMVKEWSPKRASEITGIPAAKIEAAAEIIGQSPTLVSTALQGVYQSLQATATAVQINNIHLLRGLIGKPGSTVFQMNGQPTAQNTRECGANGELVAFRNWNNPHHVAELAKVWNVEPERIPSWTPPTHAMEIFRHVEEGSIRFLWIIATNPAVSLPELKRIRKIIGGDVFVVVNDAFMTETAELADVVLPAALWAEKTGCFTNADRTVHLSMKAIEPPGEARSVLEILVDYAQRMDFRDKDGAPLIKWTDSRGAFEAWKACSKGRPCDYSGLSYEKLAGGSGIQWPVDDARPDGTERLYTDGTFNTRADYCEVYGHDLMTGAAISADEYRAADPNGRAILKTADYVPPPEWPDSSYPFLVTTGRLVYHFHTRTRTGRSKALADAAPEVFVQISEEDAVGCGIAEGDTVEVRSRRGHVTGPARIGGIEPGLVFVPFHYGSWDAPDRKGSRAANELTITGWDPVSKQPHFKYAAVQLNRLGGPKEGVRLSRDPDLGDQA